MRDAPHHSFERGLPYLRRSPGVSNATSHLNKLSQALATPAQCLPVDRFPQTECHQLRRQRRVHRPPPPPTRFARPPPPPQACREMRLLPRRMLRGEGEGQRLKRADGSAFHPNIQSSGRPPSSGEEGSCPPPTVSRLGSTEAPGDETAPRRGGQRLQTRRHNGCPRCPRRYAREQGIEDEACIPSPRGHPPTGQ